jgi:EmrB/QacA subfamily drug resistance transporter
VTGSTPAPAPGAEFPRWRVFPALALGTLMATLDISVVNIALPTLARTFHAPLTTIEWVVLAYVVTITGLLLAAGRLADMVGRRLVYGTGLAIFTLASGACAAAVSAPWLIAARALQGIGAALMTANSAALLVSNFPPEERGRALGGFGAMVGVGLALGPPLGGLIVGHLSWRWIFVINLPLGLLAQWQLRSRVPAERGARPDARIDVPGTALWFGGLVLLMLALSLGPERAWSPRLVGPLFAGALLMLALFALNERRAREPMLPLALLRGPLGLSALLALLGQSLSIAVGFHLPLYFEEVLGFGAEKSGQWLAVMPLAALLLAPLAGRWADLAGPRVPSVAGLALTAAGFVLLSGVGVSPHPGHILGGMALIGVGLGIFTVPNTTALLSAAPHESLGLASGIQATMRNLGISGGAAATAAIVASRYGAHGGGALAIGHIGAAGRVAFALATRDAFLALASVGALAAVLAGLRGGRPKGHPG